MPHDFTTGPLDDSPRAMLDEAPAPESLGPIGSDVSDLDALAAELTAETVEGDTALIPVPHRPGYAIRCRLDYTGQDLDGIRKQAKNKRFADGLDSVKFASLLLGLTTVAIEKNGTAITDEGAPVTFQTRAFQALYGVDKVDTVVRRFFVFEGHVDAAARRLADEAGWGDDLYAMDPTQ